MVTGLAESLSSVALLTCVRDVAVVTPDSAESAVEGRERRVDEMLLRFPGLTTALVCRALRKDSAGDSGRSVEDGSGTGRRWLGLAQLLLPMVWLFLRVCADGEPKAGCSELGVRATSSFWRMRDGARVRLPLGSKKLSSSLEGYASSSCSHATLSLARSSMCCEMRAVGLPSLLRSLLGMAGSCVGEHSEAYAR